jgi:hypothetical protein
MNDDTPITRPPLTEDEARAELEALMPRDVAERKRTFSALLRAISDDRPMGV